MCQVFGGAEAEDPVDNEIGLYIQSLCEKNSLLMQYKNILEQVGSSLFCLSRCIHFNHLDSSSSKWLSRRSATIECNDLFVQIYAIIGGIVWNSREDVIRSIEEFHLRKRSSGNYGFNEWFLFKVISPFSTVRVWKWVLSSSGIH